MIATSYSHEAMAEQVPTPLDKLQEQLTCPICLNQFTNPKTLTCLHSFCLECIQRLGVDLQDAKYILSCPTCRKTTRVPENGIEELPTAFLLNSLVEIQEQMRKVSVTTYCDNCERNGATKCCKNCVTECDTTMNCTEHMKPLEIFCENCQELICYNCTVSHHREHDYNLIADIFPKHRQDIDTTLQGVINKMVATQNVLTTLQTRVEDIVKQKNDRTSEIHLLIKGIIELIKQTGEELIAKINSIAEEKLKFLGEQKEEAETALAQMKSCKELIEQGLEVGSPQHILSEKKSMIQGMKVAQEQVNPETFQPAVEANITFTTDTTLLESFNKIRNIEYYLSPAKTITFKAPPMVGKQFTASILLQTKEDLLCDVPLSLSSHLSTTVMTVCDTKETEFGKHTVSFIPSQRGEHKLHIQTGNGDINGSPFLLYVLPPPEMKGTPVATIGHKGPRGIAIDHSQLIVAGYETHSITIMDKTGKKVTSFGSKGTREGQFTCPRGVAVANDGHILVTDRHRLQKLTRTGQCVVSVGSGETGRGPLQFSHPRGIAVQPTTGQIYVADQVNNRIQVLNNDLTYSHSIGAEGQLSYPYDVALDGQHNIYVVNYGSHCVDVFTSDGTHLRQFGDHGYYSEQLASPRCIAIDVYNFVYITEYDNRRISVFSTNGAFVRHIGHKDSGDFNRLCSIAIDASGALYVCDDGADTIIVL